MKTFAGNIFLGCLLFSLAAAQQTAPGKVNALPAPTPPQKRGDRPPSPGAPPAPALATTPVTPAVAAPISNTPQHAPDQLDFGTVPEGSSAKRTFSLITNAPGYVTVNIPQGPFRLVEFREMALAPGSKNPGAQPVLPSAVGARSRIRYQEGQNGPYQWTMAPNTEMQIDIVFTPKAQNGPATAASQLTTLNATGPGPHGNWALVIPLRGTLNPVRLTPESPQSKAFGNNNLPMSGKGGNSPGAAAPPTARKLSSAEARQHMRSAGKPVLVATMRNSKLSQSGIDTKTLAQLRQQKQTADQERARIIATKRGGASQTTKSIGAGGAANIGVSNSSTSVVGTGNKTWQTPPEAVANVPVCTKSAPDALIFSINGQKKGAVFTTDPDNNLFTFTGCNFGDTQGSIHLYGGFAHGNIPFEIQFWNDKSIVARVQPDLAGELDRDGVTLVLVAGNGHQTQFTGYKFYAARQTYKLASIPNPSSKIIFGPPDVSNPFNCELAQGWDFYYCGVTSPGQWSSFTVDVGRIAVKGDKGTDQFTISGLKPGFEVSDVQLWLDPDNAKDKSGWSMYSFAETISVSYVFAWKPPVANYGLQISVTGPRGLDSVWK